MNEKKEKKAQRKAERENKAIELAYVEQTRLTVTDVFLRDVFVHHSEHDLNTVEQMQMVSRLLGRTETFF